jgi:hypothetical protein
MRVEALEPGGIPHRPFLIPKSLLCFSVESPSFGLFISHIRTFSFNLSSQLRRFIAIASAQLSAHQSSKVRNVLQVSPPPNLS